MEYKIEAKVTIGIWTIVEADSIDEAVSLAEKRDDKMSFVNNSGMTAKDAWIIEEIDGDPFDLYVDKY
jgi:hypothetical protein